MLRVAFWASKRLRLTSTPGWGSIFLIEFWDFRASFAPMCAGRLQCIKVGVGHAVCIVLYGYALVFHMAWRITDLTVCLVRGYLVYILAEAPVSLANSA